MSPHIRGMRERNASTAITIVYNHGELEVRVPFRRYLRDTYISTFVTPLAAASIYIAIGEWAAAIGCWLGGPIGTLGYWYWREVRPARRRAKDFPKARAL